jgi:GTP-binding protein
VARVARRAAVLAGYGPVERHFAISAINGAGCRELTFAIMEHIEEEKRRSGFSPITNADVGLKADLQDHDETEN